MTKKSRVDEKIAARTLEAVLDHVIEKVKVSDPGHLRNDN